MEIFWKFRLTFSDIIFNFKRSMQLQNSLCFYNNTNGLPLNCKYDYTRVWQRISSQQFRGVKRINIGLDCDIEIIQHNVLVLSHFFNKVWKKASFHSIRYTNANLTVRTSYHAQVFVILSIPFNTFRTAVLWWLLS